MSTVYPGSYKYVVEFEKLLKKGRLNGLTVKDRLHFVDERDAREWVDAVSKLNRGGEFFNFKVRTA